VRWIGLLHLQSNLIRFSSRFSQLIQGGGAQVKTVSLLARNCLPKGFPLKLRRLPRTHDRLSQDSEDESFPDEKEGEGDFPVIGSSFDRL
jgi:hypothetical protein